MEHGLLVYGLLGGLAIALLHAVYTDLARREIEDWLNAGIALAAPAFWWADGLTLWPGIAWQIGLALAVFGLGAGLFALGAMGGGDVKLLGALALWIAPLALVAFLMRMAIAGGVLTLVMLVLHRARAKPDKPEIPYGLAIAFAGLWWIGERFFNQFI